MRRDHRPVSVLPWLLRENEEFRLFWFGQLVSLFGDQITLLALPLLAVLLLHAGPREMGYLTAAGLMPCLLFALHAGAWVDRRGRRRQAMMIADVGRALLLLTIPAAYAAGRLTMIQLYAVAFLVGTLSVLFMVSYGALFVSLVPRDRYVEGNALLNGSRALSFVGGPSLGGLLVQAYSAPFALVADAVSFLASAFFLGRISPREPPTEPGGRGQVVAGARFILQSPVIRAALAAGATFNFFNLMFSALFVLYATRTLAVRPAMLGAILGIGAVGAVLGSGITGWLGRRIGIGPTYMLGCVLFPLPLVLVPAAAGPAGLILAFLFVARFGSGLGVMVLDISGGAIFASLIPHHLRSRVTGAFTVVNYGVRPLGSLVGGVLGGAIGLRPTLWVATVGAVAGVLWLVRSPLPQLRTLESAAGQVRGPKTSAEDGIPALPGSGGVAVGADIPT
jgi:MFS family permease